jgi:hypothetical protein
MGLVVVVLNQLLVVVLNQLLVVLLVMVELGRALEALAVVVALEASAVMMAQVDLVVEKAQVGLLAGKAPMALVDGIVSVGRRVLLASVEGRVLVALVAERARAALADGMALGPVVLEVEEDVGLVVLVVEAEQALVALVVVVAGVILLVLVGVAGVIFQVLAGVVGVILPVLVDEVGEISLVGAVAGAVDLAGGDVRTEVHMTGTSQMAGEDMITVEDLATRVGTGATVAAQIEADHEAMTGEVIAGVLVGAEAAAGAGHVVGAAAGAGAVVEAAAAVGVAAGAVTMVQHRNEGPEQDPDSMCCHQQLEQLGLLYPDLHLEQQHPLFLQCHTHNRLLMHPRCRQCHPVDWSSRQLHR